MPIKASRCHFWGVAFNIASTNKTGSLCNFSNVSVALLNAHPLPLQDKGDLAVPKIERGIYIYRHPLPKSKGGVRSNIPAKILNKILIVANNVANISCNRCISTSFVRSVM